MTVQVSEIDITILRARIVQHYDAISLPVKYLAH